LNPTAQEQEELKKEKITNDMIMEILCTFNQEGLGPLKWWNSEK
jgi:DNA-directed RNA polymerase subunit E'/Rpb7